MTCVVGYCSIAHPYLLADNRHYPFYLWRKIIKAHWSMKYLMVPLYVFSWFSISSILGVYRNLSPCIFIFFIFSYVLEFNESFDHICNFSKISEENMGTGLFLGLCCGSYSCSLDRVQILYHTILFLDFPFPCQQ